MEKSREVYVGFLVIGVIVLLAGIVFFFLPQGLSLIAKYESDQLIKLPIIAIIGVVALLLSLAAVSLAFAMLNLSDKTQALALPEGSVRAVIALCLLVLFAIITIFLFGSLGESVVGTRYAQNLTAQQKEEFLKNTENVVIVLVTPYTKEVKGVKETLYEVGYREKADPDATARQRAKEDFAKQLLILIGTLVTAVSSFYFGTRAVTPTQAAEPRAAGTLASVKPPKVVSDSSEKKDFEISGNSLDLIREVKLVKGSDELIGEEVTSNAQVVKFKVSLAKAAPGSWDVVATDASQRVSKLQGAVEVEAAAVAQATTTERLDPARAAKTAWPKEFKIQGKELNKATVVRVTQVGIGPVLASITNKASDTLIFTVQKEKLTPGKWKIEVVDDNGVVLGTPLELDVTD
jgi:ABC-type transporter MlaC component